MNKEDIETLEDLKNIFIHLKNYGWVNDIKRDVVVDKVIKAIENLIARNKELEKQVNEYEKQLDLDYVDTNYIPKSKVREKIEELKGKIEYYKKCANIAKDRVKKRLMCDQINELKTAIKYFEELLQEGDKDETKM